MRIYTMLLFIGFCASCYSQEPFINENKLWSHVLITLQDNYPYISSFVKMRDDTLIDQINYTKVYESQNSLQDEWHLTSLIRETDAGTVFKRNLGSNDEYLLYDFGLVEEDSFKVNNEDGGYYYIDSIRSEPFGIYNEKRKHYYISADHRNNCAIWIEGVGNLHNVTSTIGGYIPLGGTQYMLCFTENDSLKYISGDSTCFKTGVYVSDGPNEEVFGNHVVQTGSSITFELDRMIQKTISLRIVDISGRVFANSKDSNTNYIQYDISNLPPGLYIYHLSTYDGFNCGKFVIFR